MEKCFAPLKKSSSQSAEERNPGDGRRPECDIELFGQGFQFCFEFMIHGVRNPQRFGLFLTQEIEKNVRVWLCGEFKVMDGESTVGQSLAVRLHGGPVEDQFFLVESKGSFSPGVEALVLDQEDLAVFGEAGMILKKLMGKDDRRRFHSDRPCVRQERVFEQTVTRHSNTAPWV